jgi:hypothetical protein
MGSILFGSVLELLIIGMLVCSLSFELRMSAPDFQVSPEAAACFMIMRLM